MTTLAKMAAGALLAAGLAGLAPSAGAAGPTGTSDAFCGDLKNAYGPYDYRRGRTDFRENLILVENGHFTSDVQRGIKGSTGTLGQDLDYALRAFPNHAPALDTLQRIALRDRVYILPGGRRPVECYFNRAIRFAADDPAVYAVYGNYLSALGRTADALNMFATAATLDPENPTVNYNLGLLHFKSKHPELANKYAQKAYALGFPLPGLKRLLVEAGKWDESAAPAPKPATPAAAAEQGGAAEAKPEAADQAAPEASKD